MRRLVAALLCGGAAFFPAGSDITITYPDGTVDRGREIGFRPIVEGGFPQEGFISADGSEQIKLRYDFNSVLYRTAAGPAPAEISRVEFRLLLANDYRIDLTSNVQVNSLNQPVFLSQGLPERTLRAPGNVKDGSNQRFVTFEYGLPTANEIVGLTAPRPGRNRRAG